MIFTLYSLNPDEISGFKQGRSRATALRFITEDIFAATDEGLLRCLIILDFFRASGRSNHRLLQNISFSQEAVMLMQSYLGNRTLTVMYSDSFYQAMIIDSGVPQGLMLVHIYS